MDGMNKLENNNKYDIPFFEFKFNLFGIREFIKRFPYNLKYRIERLKYGISQRDIWNLDAFLLNALIKGIEYLKKNGHGYAELGDWESVCDDPEKEWDRILSLMLEDFKYLRDFDDKIIIPTEEELNEFKRRQKEAFSLLERWFFDLWD